MLNFLQENYISSKTETITETITKTIIATNNSKIYIEDDLIIKVCDNINELNIYKKLSEIQDSHKFIPSLISYSTNDNEVIMRMKKYTNSLDNVMMDLDMMTKINYAIRLCYIVKWLHSHKIFHRDIAPENCLIDNNNIIICDFGASIECDSTTFVNENNNDKRFISRTSRPDIVKSIIENKSISYKRDADIWSLAITLIEMFKGYRIANICSMNELYEIINNKQILLDGINDEHIKSVINLLLNTNIIDTDKILNNCINILFYSLHPINNKSISQWLYHMYHVNYDIGQHIYDTIHNLFVDSNNLSNLYVKKTTNHNLVRKIIYDMTQLHISEEFSQVLTCYVINDKSEYKNILNYILSEYRRKKIYE